MVPKANRRPVGKHSPYNYTGAVTPVYTDENPAPVPKKVSGVRPKEWGQLQTASARKSKSAGAKGTLLGASQKRKNYVKPKKGTGSLESSGPRAKGSASTLGGGFGLKN